MKIFFLFFVRGETFFRDESKLIPQTVETPTSNVDTQWGKEKFLELLDCMTGSFEESVPAFQVRRCHGNKCVSLCVCVCAACESVRRKNKFLSVCPPPPLIPTQLGDNAALVIPSISLCPVVYIISQFPSSHSYVFSLTLFLSCQLKGAQTVTKKKEVCHYLQLSCCIILTF